MMFVDYESSDWNPMGMDLASYFNGTMMDNTAEDGSVKWKGYNMMAPHQVREMVQIYLKKYHSYHKMLETANIPEFLE